METIRDGIRRDSAADRFSMILVLIFGLDAVLLAATGVYSVASEGVAERRREIAIRSALGATHLTLIRRLSASALRFAIVGELVGLAVLIGSSRWLSTYLYELEPANPVLLAVVAGSILLVAAAACLERWMESFQAISTL